MAEDRTQDARNDVLRAVADLRGALDVFLAEVGGEPLACSHPVDKKVPRGANLVRVCAICEEPLGAV